MSNIDKIEIQQLENREWLDSLRYVLKDGSKERVQEILDLLRLEAQKNGVGSSMSFNTPYINTLPPEDEAEYPGDLEIEEKLTGMIRWNAMAMVVKANKRSKGIGGHVSTYGSIADLWEVGFHHFFKVHDDGKSDMIYFQGHATPGVYARAFLEGRITEKQLLNFRRELQPDEGLSSYPHPYLMPKFWSFPTVSMGLSPIMAIYQARFNKYLKKRGLIEEDRQKVWAFLGDGEMDEPESKGAIGVASRDKLDNLIFVVNCNLQRLDGPVRGNGKIVQELESSFIGAGWNVIKLLWGSDWDPLFEQDKDGTLIKKLNELPDGQFQKYAYSDGEFIRKDLFEGDENLRKLADNYSDQELQNLKRGGHDPVKIYQAYSTALAHKGQPTIILAQTIKGYGQGNAGEASNVSHQTKSFKKEELKEYRDRFNIPLSDDDLKDIPFIKPDRDSPEIKYLLQRREEAGGFIPERSDKSERLQKPSESIFSDFFKGSGKSEAATTMAMVKILAKLLSDEDYGKLIVPIIPDESRTFGIESLFRQVGIYAPGGQQYDPVDQESLLYYRESKEGVILEEGITEAGAMSDFIAAGTAYLVHGVNTIPFYFFYSMFGFQRIGDLIWAAADAGAKGFLIGGISGRSSMPGEGLQHQDGQSHIYAYSVPNLMAYDPAFAYELSVIVQDGIRRMYVEKEVVFYYLTVGNDTYVMPRMPKDSKEGILKGMYRFKKSSSKSKKKKAHLFGSGAIMTEVLKAAELLEKKYRVAADVWSITSYKSLYDDAIDTDRSNRCSADPDQKPNYIQQCLQNEDGVFIAASDYLKALPESVARWFPRKVTTLGTDGFGRSDTREALREFFEVNSNHIAFAALYELALAGQFKTEELKIAAKDLGIDPEKSIPRTS
ncbi:pyruvate dehydrogenase (acetyl-transferring), homodimeric type [Algoriphagus sp. AGSA1]|uniref:pyruvate dehydrogenase (acetyl-transferring), homodimeric type n=1 Tax=Algoriphagus sp. AGSA1 TaxID=2907213 RepID=UPI001F229FA9|nr:pyruvate dehydrogenase (acetyl-transferring), homodimeric type [Algoriphagus sp. AGSA1]MCE7056413.1 pyruvate dehydrogenase (acetyl-transferring), homodimeric type [Algoriphagus sp. AGSA1]